MKVISEVASEGGGIAAACEALGMPRATYYRHVAPPKARKAKRPSHRALTPEQPQEVLDVLHEERFVDLAPAQVYAQLLDEER